MTLSPQAEAHIDDRIRRLSGRRAPEAARNELRSHVADAAEGLAGSKPATPTHVDAAFAGLGTDDDIRAAFFPQPKRAALRRWEIGVLGIATVLAATAIAAGAGGTSSCSVQGPGTCEVSATGDALELLVWAGPPLLVLAFLALLPAWTATAVAGVYTLLAAVRTIDSTTIDGVHWLDLLLVAAGLVCLAIAGRHLVTDRRTRKSADASGPA